MTSLISPLTWNLINLWINANCCLVSCVTCYFTLHPVATLIETLGYIEFCIHVTRLTDGRPPGEWAEKYAITVARFLPGQTHSVWLLHAIVAWRSFFFVFYRNFVIIWSHSLLNVVILNNRRCQNVGVGGYLPICPCFSVPLEKQ